MQRLEVSGVVRLIYRSLGVKGLMGMINSFLSLSKCYDLDNRASVSYFQLQNGTIALKIR